MKNMNFAYLESLSETMNDLAIAEQLQLDENLKIAIAGDANDDGSDCKPSATAETENDAALAEEIQVLETERYDVEKQDTTGRAWKFVEKVLAMVDRLKHETTANAAATAADSSNDMIQAVSVDDMVFMAERFITTLEEFRAAGKPTVVDLGYHYTRNENLTSIQHNGLMNKVERDAKHIQPVQENGSTYGHGIYSARTPTAFLGVFGDVGLLIARLRGVDTDHGRPVSTSSSDSKTVRRNSPYEFTVLSSSNQCIPVLQYPSAQIMAANAVSPGYHAVLKYHIELQSIIDEMFNGKKVTASSISSAAPVPLNETLYYVAPIALNSVLQFQDTTNYWYQCCDQKDIAGFTCPVCCKALNVDEEEPIVSLLRCGHCLHEGCLVQSLSRCSLCPMCRTRLDKPQGDMPSGTMTIWSSTDVCAGYEQAESIVVVYDIPTAKQLTYHANPGVDHTGARVTAYLPDTIKGRKLLKRLKFAFSHGLTFSVGVSLHGREHRVTWASIPHKTALTGGAGSQGFPDPFYLDNCHQYLDALNVPPANDL